ncbi:alpha-galactosidase [Planctomycetota bacterium]
MTGQEMKFDFQGKNITTFQIGEEQKVCLSRLFDLPCGLEGKDAVPEAIKGLISFDSSIGSFSTDDMSLVKHGFDENSASFSFCDTQGHIRIETNWQLCGRTGVWSRKDTICNIGKESISLSRYLARFVFTPGNYEIFSQASSWCNENQGVLQDITHGGIVLRSEGGRTTQGGTPYMCLRNKDTRKGIAFHVLPRGNWVIKVLPYTVGNYSSPFVVVEMGLSDEHLDLNLSAGQTFELPEILIQSLPEGVVEAAAPALHRFLLENHIKTAKPSAPVVYNTWFDAFEYLEVERLRGQLEAAKEIGCEVFVVDAGWYGAEDGNWEHQVGDWREKEKTAFKGQMADFAEEVRRAGLSFGLWMEPERNFATVPAVKKNSDWFLKGAGDFYYPDLTKKQAYDYILSEMSRLVDTYDLAWMKIDFNFRLGIDPYGTEFSNYCGKWYELLDELRVKYPEVFFEGCTSGGLRLEIGSLRHFDGHFLSDNVNPSDVLRIYQQTLLRLPPGRFTKWVVLRAVGKSIPQYGLPVDEAPMSFVTPAGCGAIWELSETVGVDFAVRGALAGMLGFSGDIAGLPKETKERLFYHTEFYKKWREFIVGSTAHLLTPVKLKDDHTGWAAIQLNNPQSKVSLLCVYRLDDACEEKTFCLRGLEAESKYSITVEHKSSMKAEPLTGLELMTAGLRIKLPQRNDAAVYVIEP